MTFVATLTTDTKTIANPTWADVEREIGALDAKTQTLVMLAPPSPKGAPEGDHHLAVGGGGDGHFIGYDRGQPEPWNLTDPEKRGAERKVRMNIGGQEGTVPRYSLSLWKWRTASCPSIRRGTGNAVDRLDEGMTRVMRGFWHALLVLLLMGIALSPLRAAAGTIPMLVAYDATVTTVLRRRHDAVRSGPAEVERHGIYDYDGARLAYDGGGGGPVRRARRRWVPGALHACDATLERRQRELGSEGAICGTAATPTAPEGLETAAVHGNSLLSQNAQHVYEILRTDAAGSTEVFKYGISGAPMDLAQLGSPREPRRR